MEMNWISVKDKLPHLYHDALIVTEDGYVSTHMRTEVGSEWLFAGKYPVMYWMELPDVGGLDGVTKDKWKGAVR